MSYTANYRYAAEKAIEVLEDSDITQAPIVLQQIIERYSGTIKVVPYSKLIRKHGVTREELIAMFDSEMGVCAYEPSTEHYIIYYNDALSRGWFRFTIAHELGHIFLEHHKKAGTNILTRTFIPKEDYEEYEKEANVFGRNLLSPAPLALDIIDDDDEDYEKWDDLQSAFYITERASYIRLGYIYRDLRDYSPDMKAYVSKIQMQYQRTCPSCRTVIPRNAKFCITCGSPSRFKSLRHNPLPAYVRFDPRGRFDHCIQCGNTERSLAAKFCKICGAPLLNHCTGEADPGSKKHINPSNALFCGACGSRTVFNIYKVRLSKEEVPAMKYTDGVDYDVNSMRVKICPRCQNEEFSEKAEFCRICGTDLFNRCEGEPDYHPLNDELMGYINQHVNPSNARFCETCGKPTIYFKNNILVDYEKYQLTESTMNAEIAMIEDELNFATSSQDEEEEMPFS